MLSKSVLQISKGIVFLLKIYYLIYDGASEKFAYDWHNAEWSTVRELVSTFLLETGSDVSLFQFSKTHKNGTKIWRYSIFTSLKTLGKKVCIRVWSSALILYVNFILNLVKRALYNFFLVAPSFDHFWYRLPKNSPLTWLHFLIGEVKIPFYVL